MATEQTQAPDNQAPEGNQTTEGSFDDYFNEFSGQPSDDATDDTQQGDGAADGEEGAKDDAGGESVDQADNQQQETLTPREQEMQAQLERLRQSEASQRGRVGAYQRQINELKRQQQQNSQAAPSKGDQQSKSGESQQVRDQKQAIAEEQGSENWESFKQDFPDIADALDARFKELSRLEERVNERFASIEQTVQPIQQQAHQQYLDSQERALEARHADWRDVVNAPAFQQWLQQQPRWMQQQVESENADDASALLDIYKSTQGTQGVSSDAAQAQAQAQREKRQQRLAGAVTPQRRGAAKRDAVPDDWEGQFNHFAKSKR